MKVISDSELRSDLSAVLDHVINDHAPVFVTRPNNKNVVIMHAEDFTSLQETDYLLNSPENAKRLRESIASVRTGQYVQYYLIEE